LSSRVGTWPTGLGLGLARPGLGDVGPGDRPGREPLAGGAGFAVEELEVALVQRHGRGIAQHVHIGGDRLQQGLLLHIAQRLALRQDAGVGDVDAVVGLEAVEQRLGEVDAHPARIGEAVVFLEGRFVGGGLLGLGAGKDRVGKGRRRIDAGILRLHARIGRDVDLRTVARLGLGQFLVGRTKPRALGIQGGIVGVDVCQRALEAVGVRGLDCDQRQHGGRGPQPSLE
jgi:hypothetical protein